MFVRVKKIKGKPYAYLVENEWTPWGSRQRVNKYLGKKIEIARISHRTHALDEGLLLAINQTIVQELMNHGFTQLASGELTNGELLVNLHKKTVLQKNKTVVLSMNEGYLCSHTLQQIFSFKPEENPQENATKLANHVLEAGLKPSQEQFIHLFEQVKVINKQAKEG